MLCTAGNALACLLTPVACVKMKPENTEMKLGFVWLLSDIKTLLQG
jgi:hypothetical protein